MVVVASFVTHTFHQVYSRVSMSLVLTSSLLVSQYLLCRLFTNTMLSFLRSPLLLCRFVIVFVILIFIDSQCYVKKDSSLSLLKNILCEMLVFYFHRIRDNYKGFKMKVIVIGGDLCPAVEFVSL